MSQLETIYVRLVRARLVLALTFVATAALAAPPIPPGREAAIVEMVGGDLPDGCKLDETSVEKTFVVARYVCPASAGPVAIELRHPSDAAAGDVLTQRFAIRRGPGERAPQALFDRVVAHVRALETTRWPSDEPLRRGAPTRWRGAASPRLVTLVAVAVSILFYVLARRARRQGESTRSEPRTTP